MSNIKLTMNNWHIKDNMPYINLGNSGENNVVNLEIKVDELVEATNDTIVTYFLDIYNKQDEHTARTQLCDVNVNALTLTIPLTRSFLTNDGIKLLQVRCIVSDKQYNEISTQLSNKFHAIVGQGNYNTKYDIDNLSYGEQVVVALNSKIKDIISNIKQIETGDIDSETVEGIVADYVAEHKDELKGDDGAKGDKGDKGDTGATGAQGIQGEKGAKGDTGESAYETAVINGFVGTEAEWLATLKGKDGTSAYEIAVENGYEGTEEEWAQGLEKIQNLSLRTGEGTNSIAMNNSNTVSTGAYSIAEGNGTKATANSAHAEGTATQATGVQAHSEGDRSQATRNAAHAEGYITKATGNYSHSQNQGTIAKGIGQTAIGAYNIEQGSVTSKVDTDYAFIIGNGTDENNRSNALAVKWDGTLVFSDGSEIQSNYYVTPEMFGAVGDGVTNDLAAFQAALLQSRPIYLENKHYLIDGDLYITQPNTVIQGKCGAYSSTSPRLVFTNQHGIHIEQATYKMLFKGFAIFSDGTGLTMQGDGRIANLTFEDLYFKCRRDVFLDAETGYIYFKKCHFDFDPNTTFDGDLVKITYTGTSANRANYISFNQCEFEGQNIPNYLTDANCYLIYLDNCSNINITASDICNCYNAIKFGTTGVSQFITLTNNYLWNIKTIANLASCICFNMTGNSQYTPSRVQPIVFLSSKRGHVITGNIFNIGAWAAVSIENLYTVFDNNQIMGTISNEVLVKLHIGEYKGYVVS